MKRKMTLLITLLLFALAGQMLSAQSLKDNADYRKSVQLKKQSEAAFEEGDFPEAKRLADESRKYAELSDKWIAMMQKRYKANSALKRLEIALRSAKNIQGDKNFPEEWAQANEFYDEAGKLFKSENYEDSYEASIKGIDALSDIVSIPRDGKAAYYKVRSLPAGEEDCLWRIAGYDFAYGDPSEWPRLWKANKKNLPQPENPNLIYPDMILEIPSINGESRSGTWINGQIR